MMAISKVLTAGRVKRVSRLGERQSVLEQRMVDWLPAVALFIFVSYRGLRDTIASFVGMYSLVVYALTGIAYLLLAVYWLRGGLRLSWRFVALPAVVFAVFVF